MPLSPAPNFHWIRPGNKQNNQQKKVWNGLTWVETSIRAQCLSSMYPSKAKFISRGADKGNLWVIHKDKKGAKRRAV